MQFEVGNPLKGIVETLLLEEHKAEVLTTEI